MKSSLLLINSLVPSKGSTNQNTLEIISFSSPSSEIIGILGNNLDNSLTIKKCASLSALVTGERSSFNELSKLF